MNMSSCVTDVRREGISFAWQSFPGTVFTHQQLTTNSREKSGISRWEQFGFLLIVSKI